MGDERWVNVQQPTVDEAQRWLREHGAAYRQETTDSLLDGNDVALHWAAKVLAALDHIEVLSAEIDSLRATLAAEKVEGERLRERVELISRYADTLLAAMTGGARYTCQLCGAGPEEEHRGTCAVVAMRAEVDATLAARPSPTEEA